MADPKIKSENYQNFGGINEKYSPYVLGPMEFMDLKNFDFQTPGSLTGRWGSTMYLGQTYPGQIASMAEFTRLDGSSYIIQSYSGGIYFGATNGAAQGMSFTLMGASLQQYFGFVCYAELVTGGSLIHSQSMDGVPFFGNRALSLGAATFIVSAAPQTDNTLSTVTLNNYLFAADGNKFFKFDGATTTPVGLPPVLMASILFAGSATLGPQFAFAYGITSYPTGLGAISGSIDSLGYGATGSYVFWMSYVNNRGFEGPIWPVFGAPGIPWANGASRIAGKTFIATHIDVYTPLQYGISAINLYSYFTTTDFADYTGGTLAFTNNTDIWSNLPKILISTTPASGSTITNIVLGSSLGGQTGLQLGFLGPLANPITETYYPLGITYGNYGTQYALGNPATMEKFALNSFAPRYLEVYQNRIFSAGFSGAASTLWWSDVNEPEGYAPDFNIDVRTNDGDQITALKSYQGKLYVFKKKTFFIVLGDDTSNFSIQLVSDQYGTVNNRCVVVYQDMMLFLDRKGVMIYNGGGVDVLSKKVQNTVDRINWPVAYTTACMVHDKPRNQILVAVPLDNSTVNNMVLVYDYLAGAWTKYDGLPVSSMMKAIGRNIQESTFYGSYSGTINWFGSSFTADNATGFSAYLKSRFLHDMGDSTQKQFRRLYVNTNPPAGSTLFLLTNFYQDYGTSIVKSATIVQGSFQSRTEFGISGKSLAFEMSNLQTNIRLTVHGFTIESRMQRRV